MKMRRSTICTGLIVCIAMGVGCTQQFTKNPKGRTILIHVRSDVQTNPSGKCFVDVETANVYTPDHQKLKWLSDDGHKYTADFELGSSYPNPKPGTPFKDAQGKEKHTVTTEEPAIEPTGPHGYYYYAVKNDQGNTCLNPDDPGVHINP